MQKIILILTIFLSVIFLSACGVGDENKNGMVYYSASLSSYYQIESSSSNSNQQVLNIVSNNGTTSYNLTPTSTGYTFGNSNASGVITLESGQMGISFNSTSGSFIDLATVNTSSTKPPSGTYNAICDMNNISACQMTISNNQISVVEFNNSGKATTLCTNQPLKAVNSRINPNLFSFTCGVQAGTYSGVWYIAPLNVNGVSAFMVSEYNNSINANDDVTDEIAFPQQAINPNANYIYVYYALNGVTSGQAVGTSSAIFTQAGLVNSIVGTCGGAACILVPNHYFNNNPLLGFDYYSVLNATNYNLVGSDKMGIYQDSYLGFYL